MTDIQYRSTRRIWVEFQILGAFEGLFRRAQEAHNRKSFLTESETDAMDEIRAKMQELRAHMAASRHIAKIEKPKGAKK